MGLVTSEENADLWNKVMKLPLYLFIMSLSYVA